MANYIVKNNGPLQGEVTVSGAKNSVLPLMAATLLCGEPCIIDGVPDLRDVHIMKDILRSLGATVEEIGDDTIKIHAKEIASNEPPRDMVDKMRASFLVMGPLISRTGYGKLHMPGGCSIGERPIDLHLKGFESLEANIYHRAEEIEVVVEKDKLTGKVIYLDFPSVGATENIMMAAVLADGVTNIINAAEEPEIVDLANFLNKMGARIKGAGTESIKIEGVSELHGCRHKVIPDRIEAGTYMMAAAITRGKVIVKNLVPDHMRPIVAKLQECGVKVKLVDMGYEVDAQQAPIVATDIKTLPYPGFPTDIQSPFMALLATARGSSEVVETVFENRFMHVAELNKMGAAITTEDRKANIPGGKTLKGAEVYATDLRGGATMVLAGLVATGETVIKDIYHIERGYEKFIEKLKGLGAEIKRVEA